MSGQLALPMAVVDSEVAMGAADFVLAGVPSVGWRTGTHREDQKRPLAYLYTRDPAEPMHWHLISAPGGRSPWKWRPSNHGAARYMLDPLQGMYADTERFIGDMAPGLRAAGVCPEPRPQAMRDGTRRYKRLLLPSLAPVIIGMCWEPAVSAACFLTSSVRPGSEAWTVEVERAMWTGQPWASRLAELTRGHQPLMNALAWLYDHQWAVSS